jgi:hypothetical protein
MLNALIAFVVSTSASVSTAPCEQPVAAPVPVAISYRHQPEKIWHRPITLLARDVSFANDSRTFIDVGAQKGRFAKLTLNPEEGRTYVKQVVVRFTDGSESVFRNLDRNLNEGGLSLDLGARKGIKAIVVYGTQSAHGELAITAV